MRSRKEIAFRLRQEAVNLAMLAKPPRLPSGAGVAEIAALLPDPRQDAEEVVRLAEEIRAHRFPLLGETVDTGDEIRWRRDYRSGKETGTGYFRLIPYLDATRAGDHKNIWELNRHQHLVLLAQACLITSDDGWFDEIARELESWWKENPFQRGINWASALEVAFRALSWMWVYRMVGARMSQPFRERFLCELYRHGCYLENNLSVYFSPNTHLLGEAVSLHALGALFPAWPRSRRWAETGARVVQEEMQRQVREDGSHFEQSSYYHVYALDMFQFHGALAGMDAGYRAVIMRMAEYLEALMGRTRRLPFSGDDDGGRFFHPYGERDEFGRATLATCGEILGLKNVPERKSRLFGDAGIAVLCSDQHEVLVDAGPFGRGRAGHSHSDTLSIVVRSAGEEILIDPGTYTYVGDPEMREWFRGTGAHNTVRIDGRDQAVAMGPFWWGDPPRVHMNHWDCDSVEAECRYGGFVHRRRVTLKRPELVVIVDDVEGLGEHTVERFWHLGGRVEELDRCRFRIGSKAILALGPGCTGVVEQGWRSRVFGTKEPASVIREIGKVTLPVRWTAVIDLSGLGEGYGGVEVE